MVVSLIMTAILDGDVMIRLTIAENAENTGEM